MLREDLRQIARLFRKSPVFALTIVLTLALGVGVNTAVFSVVNTLLFRPLPVKDADRLVVVAERRAGSSGYSGVSYQDFLDFQSGAARATELAGYQTSHIGLSRDGRPERILVHYVTGNFFSLLGLVPAAGRLITPAEGQSLGADPVLVLGYDYWQRRFNGDAGIIGQPVSANGRLLTVVGVAPRSFHGVNALIEPDAYAPLSMAIIRPVVGSDPRAFWTERDRRNLQTMGRLKPGVSLDQAQASIQVVAERLQQDHPATNEGITARVFAERLARPQPTNSNPLPALGGFFLLLAGTVLLVACINVANVLLVRAVGRQRELAVAIALGARRGRLIRQSLAESLLLAVLGGLAGAVLGSYACERLELVTGRLDLPVHLDFTVDWRVFAYSLAVTVAAGMFVGIMPALRASRANTSDMLREGGDRGTAGARSRLFQHALVVAQVAGSLVLLVTAGLFVRSLQQAQRMDLGFDPEHLVNVTMDVHLIGRDEAAGRAFYDALISRVRTLPGVQSASLSHTVPFGYVHGDAEVYPEGRRAAPDEEAPALYYNAVDSGYFDNLRIAVVKGRTFVEHDTQESPRVAIVNETMARQLWPDEEPVGKRFSMESASGPPIEVVGVARDGKYIEPSDETVPYFFLPVAQHYTSYRTLQVRTLVPPDAMARALEGTIRSLAPDMPTWDVGTMQSAMNGINGLFLFRVGAVLAATLGVLGLVLAIVGLYGVVAYGASQRSREIGIRVALGAQRREILGLVVRQGLIIVAAGMVAGLLISLAVGRVVGGLLVGVAAHDQVSFVAASLLMACVAVAANLVPAVRTLRLDPTAVLRT